MRLQNDEYVKCQSKLSLKSTTDAEKENLKKRMEKIDAELVSIKNGMAPKHPQTFAYRAVTNCVYAKNIPSDICWYSSEIHKSCIYQPDLSCLWTTWK